MESQRLLEVLQYICFAGLIIPGIAAIILPDPIKKVISLFVMFLSVTVLSFAFYTGTMLFIIDLLYVLVFLVLFLMVREAVIQAEEDQYDAAKKRTSVKAAIYSATALLCCGIGYIVFISLQGYLTKRQETGEIHITSLDAIFKHIFSSCGVAVIIIIAAALATFIGFTVSGENSLKRKEI